ncbi:uncharacterized protein LOC131467541 isoform X2 [Solea solea]|uniref:uncharacterized protein LOC131467541 isoform X2 n=1 Tax=Solea solea TaxID=90069 RepID=UPI0027296D85|nr:uncharacterized protein LOC131467541 isoform X2 [Solea solea]
MLCLDPFESYVTEILSDYAQFGVRKHILVPLTSIKPAVQQHKMPTCSVVGCGSRTSTGVKFFRIPTGSHPFLKNRRRLWLQALKREDWGDATAVKEARVCSAHFISGEASDDSSSPDFVPSLFAYTKQNEKHDTKMERYHRKRKRTEMYIPVVQPDSSIEEIKQNPVQADEDLPPTVSRSEYDDLRLTHRQLQEDYNNLQQECVKLRSENDSLKHKLNQSKLTYSNVKSSFRQLVYFTGLTSIIFEWLLKKLSSEISHHSLPLEDQLLMVLMKLRLGLSNLDLAYRFNVANSTVSHIYRCWISVMSVVLKPLIKWPNKGAIIKNMPRAFKRNFKRCRCIIECEEMFIARPSNLTARAQSWSNYKHSNTIKYLIATTPAGAISFVSPGWDGRVSDKQITRESGFLELLEPMDEVLADRGFLVRDELVAYGATLRIPHFTKGKKQLSAQEVDTSRQLACVRIHIERVIGRWKSFKILQTVIPVSQVDMLDEVVTVCAALTNLGKSVVPKGTGSK